MLVKNAYFLAYNLKKSHYNKVLPLLYYISGRNYPLFYYKMSRLFAKKLDKRKKCSKNFASETLVNTTILKIIEKKCNFFVHNSKKVSIFAYNILTTKNKTL